MSHTPGPWIGFVDRSTGKEWFSILPAGRSGLIAESIQNEADAALIVAAPDMLAALREIAVIAEQEVNDLCAIRQEGGTLSAVDKMELTRWQSVGAAIAKAEGDKS